MAHLNVNFALRTCGEQNQECFTPCSAREIAWKRPCERMKMLCKNTSALHLLLSARMEI